MPYNIVNSQYNLFSVFKIFLNADPSQEKNFHSWLSSFRKHFLVPLFVNTTKCDTFYNIKIFPMNLFNLHNL